MVDIPETNTVSDLWKYIACIALACAISMVGHWLTEYSNFTTEEDVHKIVSARNEVIQTNINHQDESIRELKRVVENNTKVTEDIRVTLSAMQQELGHMRIERGQMIQLLLKKQENTDGQPNVTVVK